MLTRLEITSGSEVESATNPQATMKASAAFGLNSSRTRIASTMGVRSTRGAVIGEHRSDGRAEEHDQGKRADGPSRRPSGRCAGPPNEEPGLVEQQRDDDERHEGERGVPNDMPDHRDVARMDHARGEGDSRPAQSAPSDPRPLGCQMTNTRVTRKMASASIRPFLRIGEGRFRRWRRGGRARPRPARRLP